MNKRKAGMEVNGSEIGQDRAHAPRGRRPGESKMIRVVVMAVFCLYMSAVYPQQKQDKAIDSLMAVLRHEQSPKAIANIYDQLSHLYLDSDIERSQEYNERLLSVSRKKNYKEGIAKYHLNCVHYLSFLDDTPTIVRHALTAREIFRKTRDTAGYLQSSGIVAQAYIKQSKEEEAKKVALSSLGFVATATGYEEEKGIMYVILSDTEREANLDLAIRHLRKALLFFRKIDNPRFLLACYNRLSTVYQISGDYKEALRYALLCVDIQKRITLGPGDRMAMWSAVGEIQVLLGQYEKAQPYLLKALRIGIENGFDIQCGNVAHNLAVTYYHTRRYADCLRLSEQAIGFLRKDTIITYEPELYNMARYCSYVKGNYRKAAYYTRLSRAVQHKVDISEIRQHLGSPFLGSYRAAASADSLMGDFTEAYKNLYVYMSTKQEWNEKEKKDRIAKLQAQFELTDKNLQLKDLTIRRQKDKLKIAGQQRNLIVTYGAAGFLVLLAGGISWALVNSRRNAARVRHKNALIEASLREKNLLLREIHHRVKNNLQLVISLLNIQARESGQDDIEGFLEKGRGRIVSMALIHQHLYQSDDLVRVDFQHYLENLVSASRDSFGPESERIRFEVHAQDLYFDIQTAIPLGLIVNELLCNAMKHAFRDVPAPRIVIRVREEPDGAFLLRFSDNGTGCVASGKERSFGLELVRLLTMQLDGHLSIGEGPGTTYDLFFKEEAA